MEEAYQHDIDIDEFLGEAIKFAHWVSPAIEG